MVLDSVRRLMSCYNGINTILIASANSFTCPGRTTHHVSVAYACSDDIRRKLQQLFVNVVAATSIFYALVGTILAVCALHTQDVSRPSSPLSTFKNRLT
jgi:hypothetical protein